MFPWGVTIPITKTKNAPAAKLLQPARKLYIAAVEITIEFCIFDIASVAIAKLAPTPCGNAVDRPPIFA